MLGTFRGFCCLGRHTSSYAPNHRPLLREPELLSQDCDDSDLKLNTGGLEDYGSIYAACVFIGTSYPFLIGFSQ